MSFNQNQFEDKVVIVTGAGGGIGRSHALAFAKAGAKVVVNDLGSTRDGKGAAHNMADKVVEEIKAFGGKAIANYDSVADVKGAENIVKTAMEAYGRVDFVINNAGILRDKTFLKMTDEMWDLVIAVHLKGTYAVTKAAAPIMKEQKFGRIVNTTSMSGLLGNFGQSNYSAAKAGIYGFTRTLSMELERFGVTVNAIAPVAKTRMTDDIDAVPDDAKPEHITPMVMYLCSKEAADVNGRVFGIHGQHLFEYYMDQTQGFEKKSAELWSLSEIHEKFQTITDKNAGKASASSSSSVDSILPKINDAIRDLGIQLSKIGDLPSTSTPSSTPSLSDMFLKFTEVFVPEKAAGFEGLIQFDINGDLPQAIYVKNGSVTVKAERGSNPECTITTDKASMLDMLHGRSDPTKLFMKGKIKADKMPVLMKFGNMFDIAKLPEKIKSLGASGPVSSSKASASLTEMFQAFADVFVPEKAAGFSGLIQFIIDGDEPQALYVGDGKVTIKAEKGPNPECTITTDKNSMLDMLHGKADPTKLFMKGKIKADKMPVLMKFNAMFNTAKLPEMLNKLKGKTSSTQVTDTAGQPKSFTEKFQLLSHVFVPEKAGGFNGAILFQVAGQEPQSIYVENQKVTIQEEKAENPVLTIRSDQATMDAMFKGKLDAAKAVMQGKIKADHMSLLMKFGNMFDLAKIPTISSGYTESVSTTSSSSASTTGINRAYLGKWFHGEATHVKPENIKKYALATNDKNKSYFKDDPKEQLVPPIFPVTLNGELLEKFLTEEDDLNLDFTRMVHGEQEIIYHAPLRPWDLVYPVAQIIDIETKESGETMTIQVDGKVNGHPKFTMNVKLFVRASGKKKAGKKKEEPNLGKPFFSEIMKVEPDQTKRYAEASGDHNPIHLDPEFAKSVGLPDIILHGLCTMAFASQAIVKHMCDNDPRRLIRMSVRFSKPVLLTDVLTTKGWLAKKEEKSKSIIFEMQNQDGQKVLTNGSASILLKK